jgi:hypothetical protein
MMGAMGSCVPTAMLGVLAAMGDASADPVDTPRRPPAVLRGPAKPDLSITSREYAIELYEGVALGDGTQTGMGGAGAAWLAGSAGALLNPAAPAIRKATDNARWGWDYHLDFLTGRYSSDYDNNGRAVEGAGASLATAGLALRGGAWAFAVTLTGQTAPIDNTADPALQATTLRARVVASYFWHAHDLAIGAGIQPVQFEVGTAMAGGGEREALFAITGAGLIAGVTWVPAGRSLRVAVSGDSRVLSSEIETQTCDPLDCQGHILPEGIEAPGRLILGGAYRLAPTPWNQQVAQRFRDERALIVAGDLFVTGSTKRGHGLEAFGANELQPSGRQVTVSPRLGAELEGLPGRLRVRAGTYWEPGRFEGVRGRIHGTFGADVRALEFRLWGLRRGRVGTTIDLARRYRNVGLSIGFWH